MEIRKALLRDAANIAALGICVWIDTYATGGVFDKISRYVLSELTEERMRESIRQRSVLLCEGADGPIGYMVVGPPRSEAVEIETLYVLPKFQGQGLGRQFVEKALMQAQRSVWLSVWEHNTPALGFYRHLGFYETGEAFFDLYGEKIRNIVLTLNWERFKGTA